MGGGVPIHFACPKLFDFENKYEIYMCLFLLIVMGSFAYENHKQL